MTMVKAVKNCTTCKYKSNPILCEPCVNCVSVKVSENVCGKVYNNWEENKEEKNGN